LSRQNHSKVVGNSFQLLLERNKFMGRKSHWFMRGVRHGGYKCVKGRRGS